MTSRYGYPPAVWNAAKEEIRRILVETARIVGKSIFYSELVARVRTISLNPESYALRALLGEISAEEDAAGRGMLTALVVHKDDERPGGGFFNLAKQLGRDTSDREKCWLAELEKVYACWIDSPPI